MAKIRELFVKEIDRRINGVIKADSQEEKEFKEEIDEYVITSELTGRFNELLDRYIGSLSTQTEDVGVWISGFFGSGKSHYLKILSYILANKVVEDDAEQRRPIDFFSDKVKNDTIKGTITHVEEFVLQNKIDDIYCALEELSSEQLKNLVEFADYYKKTIKFIPESNEIYAKNLKIDYYFWFSIAQRTWA